MKSCETDCLLYQKCQDNEKEIMTLKNHAEYSQKALDKLDKLPMLFAVFQAEIQTQIRTWGIVASGMIVVVGMVIKVVK